GTFSGQPTSGSIAINYNGTNTLSLTNGSTPAQVTGTFSGSFTSGTASVTVNGTTATLTDGVGTGAGTFSSGSICVGTGQGVTINGVNLTTNATLPTGGSVGWTSTQ